MDHPAGAVAQAAAGGQGQNPVGVFRADAGFDGGIPADLVEKQGLDPVRGKALPGRPHRRGNCPALRG